ncbi:MAG TPA: outer membrane lipoprotein carrier protein LolA [Acidobacteriaceae bacterium]|nr:outer membrane lipoprotein carrier protein LolA [Acidobacteriaceae bacterium]
MTRYFGLTMAAMLTACVVFGPKLACAQATATPSAQSVPTVPAGPDPKTDPFTLTPIPATDVAARVDKHYNHIHDLQLNFVEQYTGMGIQRTEEGTLLLKKPGFMRWNYTHPRGKLFIVSKHDAYAYTPGDAQAQQFPVERLDDLRSPLRFLLGKTELDKELSNLTVRADGDMFVLRGVPVGLEKRVTSLELTVGPDGTILAMLMKEVGGAETRFQFYGENDKVDLSNSDFDFVPPAGVKVVDGLAPM